MNEQLKKECIEICKHCGFFYEIEINFDNEDWKDKFIKQINWTRISIYQKLSEKFMEKFQDKVDWGNVSTHQQLSENFIEKFQDKVYWDYISHYQQLSESFMEKFQDKLNWWYISIFQKLSENFIEKFQDRLNWARVSGDQILSEYFIEKFEDKVDWSYILHYQILSEKFMEKYIDKFDKNDIILYQRISKEFAKKHNIEISKDNWYHKSYKWKLKFIRESTNYEILNDDGGEYIIAYKAIREDNRSFYNPDNYEYIIGEIYESNCDCNILNENSYGLAAWDKENAIKFGSDREFKLILVKIYIDDIGAIIKDNKNKIRCFKFQVVEDLGIE